MLLRILLVDIYRLMNLILKSSNSMKKVKQYNERHNKKENGIFDDIYPLWADVKEERIIPSQ